MPQMDSGLSSFGSARSVTMSAGMYLFQSISHLIVRNVEVKWMEVLTMAETNTVTITLEEYFDLRQKAEMNGFLMNELGRIQQQMSEFDNRLFKCESKM